MSCRSSVVRVTLLHGNATASQYAFAVRLVHQSTLKAMRTGNADRQCGVCRHFYVVVLCGTACLTCAGEAPVYFPFLNDFSGKFPSHHFVLCFPYVCLHQGIDTGAGMILFDSPVTVATVVPNVGTHSDESAQVCGVAFPPHPSLRCDL